MCDIISLDPAISATLYIKLGFRMEGGASKDIIILILNVLPKDNFMKNNQTPPLSQHYMDFSKFVMDNSEKTSTNSLKNI